MNRFLCAPIVALGVSVGSQALGVDPQGIEWVSPLATQGRDLALDITSDSSGHVYVYGESSIGFAGAASRPGAFIAKYNTDGDRLLVIQPDYSQYEFINGIAADATGHVYVCGHTGGSIFGPHVGIDDITLAKFADSGEIVWGMQHGTTGVDVATDVAIGSKGNIFVVGMSSGDLGGVALGVEDIFVMKTDSEGAVLWERKLGSPAKDTRSRMCIDTSDNVIVCGITKGDVFSPRVGATDAILAKYSPDGDLLWGKQIPNVVFETVVVPNVVVSSDAMNNVYIAGTTGYGAPATWARPDRVFVQKYDASGELVWAHELPKSSEALLLRVRGIGATPTGEVFISGNVHGKFGWPAAGLYDVFVLKLQSDGAPAWIKQYGLGDPHFSTGLAVDDMGNSYMSSYAYANGAGTVLGSLDGYVVRFGIDAPCYADCDANGVLSVFDYICFGDAFAAQSRFADCTDDYNYDIMDYLCFGEAFAAGCN